MSKELLALISQLQRQQDPRAAAKSIAQSLGAEDLIIFIEDKFLELFSPAPGFPQTLPDGKNWNTFLAELAPVSSATKILKSPYTSRAELSKGFKLSSEAIFVFTRVNEGLSLTEEQTLIFEILGKSLHAQATLELTNKINLTTQESARRFQKLAESLDHAKQELQSTLAQRDDFLSMASHELKTPLTTLILQSQLRMRQLSKGFYAANPAEIEKMIKYDLKQFSRLNRLVEDMLNIVRIRKGRLDLHKELKDISNLLTEVIQRMMPQFEEAGVKVHYQEVHDIEALVDVFRLEQVVTNLLSNAIKYGEGSDVTISLQVQDSQILIKVADQGMGISQEDQDRIFAKFERAVSMNQVSGLGLGLFICKQILEDHGGSIVVESSTGKGATFTMILPLP
jgi:signal transduction histidine kinase